MTDRDPLRYRFDAFRESSVGGTALPPVEDIARRLRRRRRRTAGVVAAVAIVVLATLIALPSWSHGARHPEPATSPTPLPSVGSPAVVPVPGGRTPNPTGAASSGAKIIKAACTIDARGLALLPDGHTEGDIAPSDGGTRMAADPADLFDVCPTARADGHPEIGPGQLGLGNRRPGLGAEVRGRAARPDVPAVVRRRHREPLLPAGQPFTVELTPVGATVPGVWQSGTT